jgi:hypothetical protein
MSCQGKGKACANAARRNGVSAQVSMWLNTLGSWSSYRDLTSLDQIPDRTAQITAAVLGIEGLLNGRPQLAGIYGVIIAAHALEYVTGAAATTAVKLYVRGRPIGHHLGIIVRKSPFTPKLAKVVNTATGGRLLDAKGYYFFEGGKTWHCRSYTIQFGDMPKTITTVGSVSMPKREFYFDRPIYVPGDADPPEDGDRYVTIQRLIDTVIGNENPDTIPGFIGSVNEFEDLTIIGKIKRAFFLSNWILVDEMERDGGNVDMARVDYEALANGTAPGNGRYSGGYYQVTPRTPSPISPTAAGAGVTRPWPSITTPRAASIPVRPAASTTPAATTTPTGSAAVTAGVHLPPTAVNYLIDGKARPLIVKRVVNEFGGNGRRLADAMYYDDVLNRWVEVTDKSDRERIAIDTDQNRIAITDAAYWPK